MLLAVGYRTHFATIRDRNRFRFRSGVARPLVVKPHQSESDVAPLVSYVIQFITCHTKQKRFFGYRTHLPRFRERNRFRFRSGVARPLNE